MNRRTFMLGGLSLPLANVPKLSGWHHSVRQSFVIDTQVACQMIVTAHVTDDVAEDWRRTWVGRAFEGQGEWYRDSTETRTLPDTLANMPGSLHFHTYTAGVAAQRGSMLVGAFRRDHIACVIRTNGDQESTLISLAEFFAGRRVPEQWELAWNDIQLQAFIPTSETYSLPIVPDDRMWF